MLTYAYVYKMSKNCFFLRPRSPFRALLLYCVVEAQLLGRAGGEVHKIKFFLAQIIDSIDLSLLDYYTPTRFKDAANPIPRVLP